MRSIGSLDWFCCHLLKFKIPPPRHERIGLVSSLSPAVASNWAGLDSAACRSARGAHEEPTSPPAGPVPLSAVDLLAGRVVRSHYPNTHHRVEDPLLLNDLLLFAEFLWLQILFLSPSVQLNRSPSVTVATSRWGSLTRVSGEAAST